MGLPSMTPQLGIINEADAPEAKMIVVVYGHPARPHVEYVNPERRPLAPRCRLSTFPPLFTPLTKFGCAVSFDERGALQVRVERASEATYPDGAPRRWQGYERDTIAVRPQLAGHVIKAVQAMRAGPDPLYRMRTV